jgi:hypothetical protein
VARAPPAGNAVTFSGALGDLEVIDDPDASHFVDCRYHPAGGTRPVSIVDELEHRGILGRFQRRLPDASRARAATRHIAVGLREIAPALWR